MSGDTAGCSAASAVFEPVSILAIAAFFLAASPFEELSGCVGYVIAWQTPPNVAPFRCRPPRLPRPISFARVDLRDDRCRGHRGDRDENRRTLG
jgi:hypothetical protein